MIINLRDGKTEDGEGTITSEQDKTESIRLWTGRETRVLHSIVNCAIAMKVRYFFFYSLTKKEMYQVIK